MSPHISTARGHLIAYGISWLGTLVWAGCVLPAGRMGNVPILEDCATPMGREAWLLIPALLLLIVGPVGVVLSRTRVGLASVLASTDAFVAFYMAAALTAWGAFDQPVSGVLVGLLYGVGLLSVFEVVRLLRRGPDADVTPYLRGVRLALCILALLTPSWILVQGKQELASLLVPYAMIAVGSGGMVMARTEAGFRLTAALLHLAFAVHLFVVLRYTIFDADAPPARPAILEVTAFGWFTLGVSSLLLLLTFTQVVRLARLVMYGAPQTEPAPSAAG